MSAFLKGADLGLGCEETVCSFEGACSEKTAFFLVLIFYFLMLSASFWG